MERARGYHSVDALSPDGRWIYLVRYTAPLRDINRYEVVAYDLEHPGAPEPTVAPRGGSSTPWALAAIPAALLLAFTAREWRRRRSRVAAR